jgi:hypothetical protein
MVFDAQLADSIAKATELAAERAEEVRGPLNAAMRNEARLAFLAGIKHAAHLMVQHDGDITPQQLERAHLMALSGYGFSLPYEDEG